MTILQAEQVAGVASSNRSLERTAAATAVINSQPAVPASAKVGMFGMAVGVWRKATSKLFDLEAKIANQVGEWNQNIGVWCKAPAQLVKHAVQSLDDNFGLIHRCMSSNMLLKVYMHVPKQVLVNINVSSSFTFLICLSLVVQNFMHH